ncbi:MAG: serine/threonine-protein kinase PrkC, partial [Chloroflexota bacterium]
MSLRSTLLTIGGVSLAVVVLLAAVIFGLRLISAGGGPDANVKVPPIASLTLADTILSQSPEATTLVPTDSVIEVRVVAGSGLAVVPDLLGATEEEAAKRLKSANLRLGQVISAWSAEAPSGSIIQQNPRAGLQVANGSSVDLVISLGPESSPVASSSPSGAADTAVPILRCMPVGEAIAALEARPRRHSTQPRLLISLLPPQGCSYQVGVACRSLQRVRSERRSLAVPKLPLRFEPLPETTTRPTESRQLEVRTINTPTMTR